jgi:hypothetical protein
MTVLYKFDFDIVLHMGFVGNSNLLTVSLKCEALVW